MDMWSLALPLQDGATPLFKASFLGHTPVVKLLLEVKANPDVQDKVSFTLMAFVF